MKRLENVTLEISAKPLFQKDDAFVLDVFRNVFRHWWTLLKDAEHVSLLWWLSDGTDILEYDGNMDTVIEWGMWQGFAHPTVKAPDKDPNGDTILTNPRLYRPNPVKLSYGDLKRIVALMKQAAREVLDAALEVGIPFDPGSEFCRSPFRYERHPEMLLETGAHIRCIDATGKLAADPSHFAGFPDGLPEGTPFGTFFGRQAQHYMQDLGFHYIWFSNSFGYGRSPYAFGGAGQFFDGETYTPAGNTEVRDAVFGFWKLFRAECPERRIECRGTDFTVGMNLVNHATPYAELYSGDLNITPPPNTPWPALTQNHGLALAGYLSRISAFRGERFPFRYYTTDPWFCNDPWMDRWERNPHDIYLSTAIARMDEAGRVQTINDIRFLSIDTSWGDIPEQVPDEVIPHIKRAVKHAPDAVPPVVWVYPFEEYGHYTFDQPERIAEPMAGDLFIQHALNHGLPMSGVVTTAAFARSEGNAYTGSVLVTPVPVARSDWEKALLAHVERGGSLICYGPTDHASGDWLRLLGLAHAAPVHGDLDLQLTADIDSYEKGAPATRCHHNTALSAGGIREIADGANVLAMAGERVEASINGRASWVRGTSSVTVAGMKGRNLSPHQATDFYPCEILMRQALARLGWEVAVRREAPSQVSTHLMLSRCRNGFMIAGYSPDDSVAFGLRAPLGAPILPGRNTRLDDGKAIVPVNRWFHEECRVFVEQDSGRVGLHANPIHVSIYRRRWWMDGLENATVRFFPETGCEGRTSVLLNSDKWLTAIGDPLDVRTVESIHGTYLEMHGVTGDLTFAWSPERPITGVDPVLPGTTCS